MNGHIIYPSKYIKYLGIYLDETLNGGYHCGILAKKLKRANGMMCKARHYISSDDLKSLYFAIFHHIFYTDVKSGLKNLLLLTKEFLNSKIELCVSYRFLIFVRTQIPYTKNLKSSKLKIKSHYKIAYLFRTPPKM